MSAHVLVIDNYDSFTFNLVQALCVLGARVTVLRNDEIDAEGARSFGASHLLISPGPGRPEEAGNTLSIIAACLGQMPLLGVCLGHQALAHALGGRVVRAAKPMHGKASRVYHDGKGLYRGLPTTFMAGRYHSLVVAEEGLPAELCVDSYTSDGEIMGLRHRTVSAFGVQFHPESVLTPEGPKLLARFLEERGAR